MIQVKLFDKQAEFVAVAECQPNTNEVEYDGVRYQLVNGNIFIEAA